MRVIHTITTTANIDNIPIVDGQILALWDTDAWYYDMGGQRRSVSGVKFLDVLPPLTDGVEGVIYVVGVNLYKFTPQEGFTLISNIDDSNSSPASTYSSEKIDQLLELYIPKSEKGEPDGVASLDSDGLIPEGQLPDCCRSVTIVQDYSDLPETGDADFIYFVRTENRFFQWVSDSNEYCQIGLVLGHDLGTAYPGDEGISDHNAVQVIDGQVTALITRIADDEENIRNLQLSVNSLQGQIDQIPINYLVNVNNVETDLEEALEILDKPSYNNADLLVLVDTDRKTKAYVYDAAIENWVELSDSGTTVTYNANNIYFTKDILCAGMYTQVGNIEKPLNGVTTIPATNKSLAEVMDYIFTKEIQPTKTDPTVTLEIAVSEDVVEIGDSVSISYTATSDTGHYTFDSSTGVDVTGIQVTDKDSHTYTYHTYTGTFPPMQVVAPESQSYGLYNAALGIEATISYTAGIVAHTNMGNESDPVVQISAGSASDSKSALGRRSLFYGVVEYGQELSGSVIRNLTNVIDYAAQTGKTFTVDVSESGVSDPGAIVVAIPHGGPVDIVISHVTADGYFDPDVTSSYELLEDTIEVEGANGFTAVPYDIWMYQPDVLYTDDVHHITLS